MIFGRRAGSEGPSTAEITVVEEVSANAFPEGILAAGMVMMSIQLQPLRTFACGGWY
jgi:hypothetical protein